MTELTRAIAQGDAERVAGLLADGADPNEPTDEHGLRPLFLALEDDHLLALLLAHGASPNLPNPPMEPEVHQALVEAMCRRHGCRLDGPIPRPALVAPLDALINRRAHRPESSAGAVLLANARRLLDAGAEVDGFGSASYVARAVFWLDAPMVELLLGFGADPNQRCRGLTPLLVAAAGADAGAPVEPEADWHEHADRRAVGVVTALLAHGADREARDGSGATALLAASRSARVRVVRVLLAARADAGAVDRAGRSALDVAASNEVRALLRDALR